MILKKAQGLLSALNIILKGCFPSLQVFHYRNIFVADVLLLQTFELKDSGVKVIDMAIKYGYHSPDSFARAFQNLHGISPSEAKHNGHSLKAYPRMTFQLSIKGGNEMNYRIEEKEAFRIVGIKKESLFCSKE
ncbi:hypothetical protein QNN00_11710 [Bacillus velezensis]|nr:hypothetical protein [Bacillus velezensis]